MLCCHDICYGLSDFFSLFQLPILLFNVFGSALVLSGSSISFCTRNRVRILLFVVFFFFNLLFIMISCVSVFCGILMLLSLNS